MQSSGLFNIGLVAAETGVPPDTLRVWERRYGLPSPQRTDGGHRLYSADDIDTIHWLVGSKQRGLSIRRAVDLWQQRHALAATPLEDSPELEGASLDETRTAWRLACQDFDEARAEALIAAAFALYPAETVVPQVLLRGLAELGEAWQHDQVSVQQEHFASALVLRRLHTLVASCPAPHRDKTVLAACPPGEEHSLGLLYLTWRLRRQGWPVVYLGDNVPRARLESILRHIQPDLALMAASHLPAASTLLEGAKVVNAFGAPLVYGGRAFAQHPELRALIPGHFLGESLEGGAVKLFTALEQGIESPGTANRPPRDRDAEAVLQAQLNEIGLHVSRVLSRDPFEMQHLEAANAHWTRTLLAALRFDKLELLRSELEWVATLLHHHGIPQQALTAYLRTYQQAAEQYLVGEYQPLAKGVQRVIANYLTASQN